MVNPLDNYWASNSIWSPKEKGGKRTRGFLTKLYGFSGIVFIKQDNRLVKSNVSIKDLKKLVGKKKLTNKGYWYRVNNVEWIDADAKKVLVDGIVHP